MYDNIGTKIKDVAIAFCIIGIIASIVSGIILVVAGDGLEIVGFLVIGIGSFLSWLSSFPLYGFGEMIDKLSAIEENTRGGKSKAKNNTNAPAKASNSNSKKNNSAFKEKAVFEDEYVDVVCPECGETLSFNKSEKNCQCPFCDCTFEI